MGLVGLSSFRRLGVMGGGEGGDGGDKTPQHFARGDSPPELLKDIPPNLYKNTLYYKIHKNSE